MVKDQEYLEKKALHCLDLAKKLGATATSVNVGNSISETVNFRNKKLDESFFEKGKNEFNYVFPKSQTRITYKYLDHSDEQAVNKEIKGLQKINPKSALLFKNSLAAK